MFVLCTYVLAGRRRREMRQVERNWKRRTLEGHGEWGVKLGLKELVISQNSQLLPHSALGRVLQRTLKL